MQGWIKLHRSLHEHWLYKEKRLFSKYEAWIDLLLLANHEDGKVLFGNKLIEIKRGQRVTSIRKLGERWQWSNNKVTQFLHVLKLEGMVSVNSDTKKTTITVENYDSYQDSEDKKKTVKEHQSDTKATVKHTNKNVKNEKNNTLRSKLKFETHHLKLAELLLKKIQANYPKFKSPNLESWANTMRLMMERDNRQGKEIQDVIMWCQSHHFWYKNILSADKLRKQFDRLQIDSQDSKHSFQLVNGSKPSGRDVPNQFEYDINAGEE